MNRLEAELARLYGAGAGDGTRVMVLELARPANWEVLGKVWQGVQADVELPAPAIAVDGQGSYQLWFSFVEPTSPALATAFFESLRRRYLGGVKPDRIALRRETPPPPIEKAPGQWSAFLTPDLAALFTEEPWLDLAPSADAQADVLSRLKGIRPDELKKALDLLAPVVGSAPSTPELDPRRFLRDVMNDSSVDLHLRIEAAKALL